MKLIRYNDPLSTQLRAFNNLFGQPLSGGFGSLDRLLDMAQERSGSPAGLADRQLAADLYEDKDNYYARLEMPGAKKTEVKVALDERLLSIAFEKSSDESGKEQLSSQRSLTVPDGIDATKVEAKLEDGMLTVVLPKAEARKPKEIKVK